MEKLKTIIDYDYKNKTWFSKNYFFAGSALVILVNILLFSFFKIDFIHTKGSNNWTDIFNFSVLTQAFWNSFTHLNWQHVLLNMLCFFICGLYLERKTGSIKIILIILALAFFTSAAISANNLSVSWAGFSGVNFGLYAYIIIDYLFSFQKARKNKFNIISGAIVLALIYLAMCFNGGTTSFGFKWYPYDLLNNMGHYSGALTGLIFGLTVQIAQLKIDKETQD